jgi:hypothetical protein
MALPGLDFITPQVHGLAKFLERKGKKVIVDYANVREQFVNEDETQTYTIIHVPLIIKHGRATFKVTLQIVKSEGGTIH